MSTSSSADEGIGTATSGAVVGNAEKRRTRHHATFFVADLECRTCARHAEDALAKIDGVSFAEVRFLGEMAQIAYDVTKTSDREIARAMRRAGYRLHRIDGVAPSVRHGLGRVRLGVTLLALVELVILSRVRPEDPAALGIGVARLSLSAIALTLGGSAIAARAWRFAKNGVVGRDAMIATAAIGSFVVGCFAHWYGARDLGGFEGFEASAAIIASALVARAAYALLSRFALADLALRQRAGEISARRIREPSPDEIVARRVLAVGDRVRVLEGETVAAELCLETPALLSGPLGGTTKQPGDVVEAGMIVLSGSVRGRVTAPHESGMATAIDAEVHRVIGRVERELGSWSSGEGWADLAAQSLFACAFTLAVFAVVAHFELAGGGAFEACFAALAVIVVASPSAFVLAAPLARTIAIARARALGVVVRDPAALDALARITAACFEKTGTVTAGAPEVNALVWTATPERGVLEEVLAVELHASHPAGRAIASYLSARGVRPATLAVRAEETAGGISARVSDALVEIGSPRRFPNVPAPAVTAGSSLSFFARNGVALGYFALTDPLRPGADAAARGLWQRGVPSRIVSGDRSEATQAIANRVGVPASGGLSPAAKALVVRDLQHAGARVLYVHDATNASGASHADVSIAVAPVAMPSFAGAPIVMVEADLARLPWLLDLARAARARRIECCALAVVYNAVLVPAAALGWVTPREAAALALIESLFVLANAARLLLRPTAKAARRKT